MSNKTTLDAMTILYGYIKASELFTSPRKPNGGLYKGQRPANSTLEDVVINSLVMNRADVQAGVFNVNLFVPNLEIMLNGIMDKSQPNTARLTELSGIFSNVMREVWADDGDYTFNIQQDQLFSDTNNQHYQNFRIEFYSQNLKN